MADVAILLDGAVWFDCPGCGFSHALGVGAGQGPRWWWNESLDAPTFSPSVLVRHFERLTPDEIEIVRAGGKVETRPLVCHSFVREGMIEFLTDSTHDLAGQTVPLPPVDSDG